MQIMYIRVSYNNSSNDLNNMLSVLRKCKGAFCCLIFDMLSIRDLKPFIEHTIGLAKSQIFYVITSIVFDLLLYDT